MSIMGIDIGNTCSKVSVFSERGELLTTRSREHGLIPNVHGYQEIATETVMNDICSLIKACAGEHADIRALAVSCMSEAFAAFDKEGRPLTNSPLTHDMRAQAETDELVAALGERYIKKATGIKPNAKFTAPKLFWLKKHEPGLCCKAKRYLSWMGIACLLFGFVPHCDYAIAGKTMLFDIRKKRWDEKILAAIGLDSEELDVPVQAGASLGRVSSDKCKEFGFIEAPEFIVGSFDQACVNIGSGISSSEEAALGMGTVFCMINNFTLDYADKLDDAYPVVPDIVRDKYITTASVLSGGQAFNWAKQLLYDALPQKGNDLFRMIDKDVEASCNSLLIFPYFAGSGTPTVNPCARGAIYGLTVSTTRGDILRALMEGIAFEIRLNLEKIEETGSRKKRVIASGGCSKSAAWNQIVCNVLNRPLAQAAVQEAGSLGVAALAAYGAGLYATVEAAIAAMVREPEGWCYPDPEAVAHYDALYKTYCALQDQTILGSVELLAMG